MMMKRISAGWIAGSIMAMPLMAATPATYTVGAATAEAVYVATGTVRAVRQGTLGAEVAGRITEVRVRSGDVVAAGEVLLRIEAGSALDAEVAAHATAAGAEARLVSARADFERAQQLRAKDYISIAALQRAEAALRSAEAEAHASSAQASAARTRAGWHTVRAPYAGHVTDVWVTPGDLATPGRALVTLHDPKALRVIAHVPDGLSPRLRADHSATLVTSGARAPARTVTLRDWRVVPAVDTATRSVEVRAELPVDLALEPGQFVELHLPVSGAAPELHVPRSAVLRRSEVTAVYVLDEKGLPRLRQVRLGERFGADVQVLAGLQPGEQVVLDSGTVAGQ
jgi:RND family efflux transporter MFP subunit